MFFSTNMLALHGDGKCTVCAEEAKYRCRSCGPSVRFCQSCHSCGPSVHFCQSCRSCGPSVRFCQSCRSCGPSVRFCQSCRSCGPSVRFSQSCCIVEHRQSHQLHIPERWMDGYFSPAPLIIVEICLTHVCSTAFHQMIDLKG